MSPVAFLKARIDFSVCRSRSCSRWRCLVIDDWYAGMGQAIKTSQAHSLAVVQDQAAPWWQREVPRKKLCGPKEHPDSYLCAHLWVEKSRWPKEGFSCKTVSSKHNCLLARLPLCVNKGSFRGVAERCQNKQSSGARSYSPALFCPPPPAPPAAPPVGGRAGRPGWSVQHAVDTPPCPLGCLVMPRAKKGKRKGRLAWVKSSQERLIAGWWQLLTRLEAKCWAAGLCLLPAACHGPGSKRWPSYF